MTEPQMARSSASGLTYLFRPAQDSREPSFLLLHGLTGDEKVMWVLEGSLPDRALIASPRAPFAAQEGGQSWSEVPIGQDASITDFQPVTSRLSDWIAELERRHSLRPEETYLVGFSQGAALSFALVASGTVRPAGIIALAAFLPEGDLAALSPVPVYWGHGSRDEIVSPERARADIERLKALGVEVRYCEADVGHKVGVECMRGLKDWLRERGQARAAS